jgi:hypothetical protein
LIDLLFGHRYVHAQERSISKTVEGVWRHRVYRSEKVEHLYQLRA